MFCMDVFVCACVFVQRKFGFGLMAFGYVKISLYYSFYLLDYLFIYWLHWVLIAAWVFSSCGDLGLLSCGAQASHCGAWASDCGAFSCWSSWALERWLSICGAWAQQLPGMWDLPGSGIEPVLLALQGGFLTKGPPGKSNFFFFYFLYV